jgi:exo-beta-1,3-glucanase (GH17 family)
MIEDELEQFREEWKAELRQKTRRRASTASSGTVTAAISDESLERTPANLTGHLKSAVEVYRRAVDLEQRGQFDDALRLYRQVSKNTNAQKMA